MTEPRSRLAITTRCLVVQAVLLGVTLAPAARAQTGGQGSALGVETRLVADGTLDLTLPPTPFVVVGPTGLPFNAADTLVNIDTGQGLVILGVFNVSTLFPGSGATTVDSTANVANLDLGGPLTGILEISATLVESTGATRGTCGQGLTAATTTSLQDLSITILGQPVNGIPDGSVPPNTVVGLPGIPGLVSGSLVLHEQVVTGDGVLTRGAEVNAIHLVLDIDDPVGGGPLLDVDLVISGSSAGIDCTIPVELQEFTIE